MRVRVVLAVAASIVAPVVSSADPFADFRIPEHVRHSASADLRATADWDRSVNSGYSDRSDSWLGSGSLAAVWARDSDRLAFGGSMLVSSQLSQRRDLDQSPSQQQTNHNDYNDFRIAGATNLRWYPGTSAWGFQVTASATHGQSNRNSVAQSVSEFDSSSRETNDRRILRRVNGSGALGFGRVRDAAPVYLAHVLEERLLASGTLSRPFSAEALQRIIDVVALRPQFAVPHERPDRFFWHEIERIAIEDGASDGFDAASAFRADEPIQPSLPYLGGVSISTEQRPAGFFIGAAIDLSHEYVRERTHNTTIGPPQDVFLRTASYSFDLVRAGPRIAFHRPMGWNWQAGIESQALVTVHPDEDGLEFTSDARLTWLVADRWKSHAGIHHERVIQERRIEDVVVANFDYWRISWGAALVYYVEDRTEISLSLVSSQGEQSAWTRSTSINLGANYRFWGWFDAPVLLEPQRQLFGS